MQPPRQNFFEGRYDRRRGAGHASGAEAGTRYVQVLLCPERIAPAQLYLCIVGGAAGEKFVGTFQLCDMVHQVISFLRLHLIVSSPRGQRSQAGFDRS